MGEVAYENPGGFLWTRGLASCIGVLIYGNPTGSQPASGKIMAHIRPTNQDTQIAAIDSLVNQYKQSLPNMKVLLVAPDLRPEMLPAPPHAWSPTLVAVSERMTTEIWAHFVSYYSDVDIRYHRIQYSGTNGELVILDHNGIYVDGNPECQN